MTSRLSRLRDLLNECKHLPNWEYDHFGGDDQEQFYNWTISARQESGNTVHICTGESNHAAGKAIALSANMMKDLLSVVYAVHICMDLYEINGRAWGKLKEALAKLESE